MASTPNKVLGEVRAPRLDAQPAHQLTKKPKCKVKNYQHLDRLAREIQGRQTMIAKDKFYLALGRKMVSPALKRCQYQKTFSEAEVDMKSIEYAPCLNFRR